eukprot:7378392-Prymnesium_polylepis.1
MSCSAMNAVMSSGDSKHRVSACISWRGAPWQEPTAPSAARKGSSHSSALLSSGPRVSRASASASEMVGSRPSLRSCLAVRARTVPKQAP